MLGVNDVAVEIRDNLQQMWGITAAQVPVLYGAHLAKAATQTARVVVGLSPRFQTGPASGSYSPGPHDLGDGTAARTLYTREQEFSVWVRGPAPARTVLDANVVEVAQELCAALVHKVIAGLWVAGGGGEAKDGAIVVRAGEWLTLESADFRNGAEVRLDCVLRVPVLDAPRQVLELDINNATTATYAESPDGEIEELVAFVGPSLPGP